MAEKATSETPALNQEQGLDEPKFITPEQLNAAITARLRSFEAKQQESLSRIEGLLTQQKPAAQVVEEVKPQDNMVLALQNQVKILQEKDKRAREVSLKQRIHEELLSGGVNPKMVKPLLAMFEVEKAVSYNSEDSEELIFKANDAVYTLKDGISNWLKSDDAKPYLSPKGTAGSGDKAYKAADTLGGKQINKFTSNEQAGQALLSVLMGTSGE